MFKPWHERECPGRGHAHAHGRGIQHRRADIHHQGETGEISISLNRGAHFKRDVQLAITVVGIAITPNDVLIKASGKPEVLCQVNVPADAAIGEYRVLVTGTPEDGEPTSMALTVKVILP